MKKQQKVSYVTRWDAVFALLSFGLIAFYYCSSVDSQDLKCSQPRAWVGTNQTLNDRYQNHLTEKSYIDGVIDRFSGAIKIPTVSFDSMRGGGKANPKQDPVLHEAFLDFHQYLMKTYPLLHEKLDRVIVNQYSLLYVWKGRDLTLKPGMLMAHQDVVPVDPETTGNWLFPPFSGTLHDGRIYGRGAYDTKMTLISIFEAVTALLEEDFVPIRSYFLSFGHDEEISGFNGILSIVKLLQKNYGIEKNGIAIIIDEGMSLIDMPITTSDPAGARLAMVGVSEKGYMDLNITIKMKKGGHSSLPVANTAIGILSQMIVAIEANPQPLVLKEDNPVLDQQRCIAIHTNSISAIHKFALKHSLYSVLIRWFVTEPILKASIQTTQAVDIISGGVKVNAIPTSAFTVINLRINPHESVQIVADRVQALVAQIAKIHKLDLTSSIHVHEEDPTTVGSVHMDFEGLEPSPVSPVDSFAFKKLSSVIRHLFGNAVTVVPALMIANTDTKFVWQLSENIFRFMPFVSDGSENVHTVNENTKVESLVSCVRFYHELIRAF